LAVAVWFVAEALQDVHGRAERPFWAGPAQLLGRLEPGAEFDAMLPGEAQSHLGYRLARRAETMASTRTVPTRS
jgi:hypothetical protein